MTIEQKKKVLQRIVAVESDIETLKKVRMELVSSGFASASLASGGGNKSYTRIDVDKVTSAINSLVSELKSLRSMLKGTDVALPRQILTVYC